MPQRKAEDEQVTEEKNPVGGVANDCPQCSDLFDGADEHRGHGHGGAR